MKLFLVFFTINTLFTTPFRVFLKENLQYKETTIQSNKLSKQTGDEDILL